MPQTVGQQRAVALQFGATYQLADKNHKTKYAVGEKVIGDTKQLFPPSALLLPPLR